jgi:hypothetical protein
VTPTDIDPTPTATETLTPTPTFTPSPIPPSATPAGYYVDNKLGYSILLPSSWNTVEGDNGTIIFIDPNAGIMMIVNSEATGETHSAREIADVFKESAFPDDAAVFGEPFEVAGAKGISMEAVDFTITNADS